MRDCEWCGDPFEPTRARQKFCHVNCRTRAYKQRKRCVGVCEQCCQPRGDGGTPTLCANCAELARQRSADRYYRMDAIQYGARLLRLRRWAALKRRERRHATSG